MVLIHWRSYPISPASRPLALLALPAFLAIGLLGGGCGDDEPETQPFESGLQELQGFAAGAANSTEGQVLQAPSITALLSQLGLTANQGTPLLPPRLENLSRGGASLPRRNGAEPRVMLQGFGTYERAAGDTTGPFRGWLLSIPDVPPDGFVFRFQTDDDIFIIEEGSKRHLAGEIRFLQVQADDNGTPSEPLDDIITHVTFEIQVVGETPDPLVRIEYAATLDSNREAEVISIGNEGDLDESYFGGISFALRLDGTGDDFAGLVQLVDTSINPNYAVRLVLTATAIGIDEIPESAGFSFGYGRTNNPQLTPWEIASNFDNFRLDEETQEVIADVDGTITYNGRLVATLQGNTSQVPVNVDTDGDNDVDANDTCVNVTLTRVGSQPQNICEALGELNAVLPFQQGGSGFRLPFGD